MLDLNPQRIEIGAWVERLWRVLVTNSLAGTKRKAPTLLCSMSCHELDKVRQIQFSRVQVDIKP